VDCKYIVSLTTPKGKLMKDMTTLMQSGSMSRKKNDISGVSLTLTNDETANSVLNAISSWGTWVRVEESPDDSPDDRTIIFEGPITDKRPGVQGIEVTGSDQGAYWPKVRVEAGEYVKQDVAFLAQSFLSSVLAKNPNALPIFKVSSSGYLDDLVVDEAGRKFVSDYMSGFPGLIYTFVGRQLFLFGFKSQPESIWTFDDESWESFPVPEDIGSIYANGVLVVGKGDIEGYVELDDIDTDVGLLVRRFDLPEITNESVAVEAARAYLVQTSKGSMLASGQVLPLKSSVAIGTNDLIPGSYVDVKTYITGTDKIEQMMVDSLEIDLVLGRRSVGLSSVDLLGVGTNG
jgi:hypothetical protein